MSQEPYFIDLKTPELEDHDVKAINNSITNILRTSQGSLIGMPEFGSRLQELVFGQLDHITVDMLKRLINEALNQWEDRINITDISVAQYPEYNRLIATIKYSVKNDVLSTQYTASVDLT